MPLVVPIALRRRRPSRRHKRECLSSVSSDQGRDRALAAAVPGGREKKSELRPELSKCRWLLVLFDGWEEGFCRSLSHLLCSQSPRKDRRTYGMPPVLPNAIERGIGYYVKNLFDAKGLPLPFSKAPRLTVYRRELYDYAECINLAVLLYGRFPELDKILSAVVTESARAVAKIRRLVSGSPTSGRLGQCPDASLGSVAGVPKSLLPAVREI